MTLSPRIRELLDACRPETADQSSPAAGEQAEARELFEAMSADPEIRELAERAAAFDRAVRTALVDVPVPEGLADRLLRQLNLTSPEAAQSIAGQSIAGQSIAGQSIAGAPPALPVSAAQADLAVPDLAVPDLAVAPQAIDVVCQKSLSATTRRPWLSWSLATMASVALLGTVIWFSLPAIVAPQSAEELALTSVQWAETAQGWTDCQSDEANLPADHRASRQIRGRLAGWKAFSSAYDRQTLAYALRGRAGEAWLFVARTDAPFLPPDGRPERLPTTGGITVAAWREGDLLFVLACRERQQRLEDFLVPRKLASLPSPTHVLTVQTPKSLDNGDAA